MEFLSMSTIVVVTATATFTGGRTGSKNRTSAYEGILFYDRLSTTIYKIKKFIDGHVAISSVCD